jgi:uncharacterized protein
LAQSRLCQFVLYFSLRFNIAFNPASERQRR